MNSTSLWYTTRASGIVSLVLLTLTMVLGLTTTGRMRARHWPGFAQQEIHRRISIMAVVFLGIHVLTSVLDTFVHIGWLAIVVPFASPYSRFWVGLGTLALDLMLAVFVSSLLRARYNPSTWRGPPLVGLRVVAHRFGPYVWHGNRRKGALGYLRSAPSACSRWPSQGSGDSASLQAGSNAHNRVFSRPADPPRVQFHRPSGSTWRLAPSQAPTRGAVHQLLGHPGDLEGHLDTHGPLDVALGRSRSWQGASWPVSRPLVWPVGAAGPSRPRSS